MLPLPLQPRLVAFPRSKDAQSVVMTREVPVTSRSDMDGFLCDIERVFLATLTHETLLEMSQQLQSQFRDGLKNSKMSMLPSYNHTMPTGYERGTYLALDVGGSTFRTALVELGGELRGDMEMVKMRSFKIDNTVRALKGYAFFDWMAERIEETLSDPEIKRHCGDQTLAMGLAWSFPVEQTSMSTGTMLGMGKGFSATIGTVGQELGELIMQSCRKRKLNVKMEAIINDGAATLLSRAYQDSRTRMALIVGTGMNSSIMLPVGVVSPSKFGARPKTWHEQAEQVLVNAELSMFGRGVLPMTKWDDHINATHDLPDFQPFEYLTGGRYLSEITRLVLLEAIDTAGLFSGEIPRGLDEPYSLETGIIAVIEADRSATMSEASKALQQYHPLSQSPTTQDMQDVKRIALCVTERATRLLATGIHALRSLQLESEHIATANAQTVAMGCNGSIIEKYPGFRQSCQAHLDALANAGTTSPNGSKIQLEVAIESAIFGAAVAVSCAQIAARESSEAG